MDTNELLVEKVYRDSAMDGIMGLILLELRAAKKKHPAWPTDRIHAVGIVVEEAGEAMQAAIDCVYGRIEHLMVELAQTGAVAIRALMSLELERMEERRRRQGTTAIPGAEPKKNGIEGG